MRRLVWLYTMLVVLLAAIGPSPAWAISEELVKGGLSIIGAFLPVSDSELSRMSQEIDEGLVREHGTTEEGLERVRSIVTRLVVANYPDRSRKVMPRAIRVLRYERPNAMVTRDYLYTTDSLLALGLTDDELAAILGHEIAHQRLGHMKSAVKNNQRWSRGLGGLLYLVGASAPVRQGISLVTVLGLLKNSRDHEYQADAYGNRFAVQAGFQPGGLASALAKLGRGPGRLAFLSTHPDTKDRIARLGQSRSGSQRPLGVTDSSMPLPIIAGTSVVVVVDPEASQSYGYGFGRGYYYNEDLSRVAKQEAEAVLERRGYQVLVSTRDVGPVQDEIELENSEWGERGEGRTPKGEFAGAEQMFYVSAYILQERGFAIGDWRNQLEAAGLQAGVMLRQIETRTRKQLQTYKGKGSVLKPTKIRASLGRGWDPLRVEVNQIDNLARKAIAQAVGRAIPNSKYRDREAGHRAASHPLPPMPAAPAFHTPPPAPKINLEAPRTVTLHILPFGGKRGGPEKLDRLKVGRYGQLYLARSVCFYRRGPDGLVSVANVLIDSVEGDQVWGHLPKWDKLSRLDLRPPVVIRLLYD